MTYDVKGIGGIECNCHTSPHFLVIGTTMLAGVRCHVWFVTNRWLKSCVYQFGEK